ncbi:C-X-C motif chemokine 16 isoform X1 [Saccopteryx bilineata]|uniref:C-X-C motif chemokine 16 isoform X1 n=1 Tax=Saccopteryx bilineata TaxID=59482 RepID=UPI0033906DAE
MKQGGGPQSLLLLLLLLAQLTRPGTGNEGSSTGSCYCDKTFSSASPPTVKFMKQLRRRLENYTQCITFVRFQLPLQTVCGGSKDQWVTELMSCFDRRDCGCAYSGRLLHPEHLTPPSTQVPEPTEWAAAQTYLPPTLQSTQQATLPAGTLPLDRELTHANEITTSAVGHSREAGENQKQMEENVVPTAGTPVIVPVLSLLAVSFILTAVLLTVVCKRRSKKSLQYTPAPHRAISTWSPLLQTTLQGEACTTCLCTELPAI